MANPLALNSPNSWVNGIIEISRKPGRSKPSRSKRKKPVVQGANSRLELPLLIKFNASGYELIINSFSDVPRGSSFVILERNYQRAV